MKFAILTLIAFVCACSDGGSESADLKGSYEAQDNVDVSDIEGFWVNACVESLEFENIYTREFIDYKSDRISNSQNQISFGQLNSSDSNCSQAPVPDPSLTDIVIVPYLQGVGTDFEPVGIFTNTEGVELKVIEFDGEINNSTHLAYYTDGDFLYFAYQIDSSYELDYGNPYRSGE